MKWVSRDVLLCIAVVLSIVISYERNFHPHMTEPVEYVPFAEDLEGYRAPPDQSNQDCRLATEGWGNDPRYPVLICRFPASSSLPEYLLLPPQPPLDDLSKLITGEVVTPTIACPDGKLNCVSDRMEWMQ